MPTKTKPQRSTQRAKSAQPLLTAREMKKRRDLKLRAAIATPLEPEDAELARIGARSRTSDAMEAVAAAVKLPAYVPPAAVKVETVPKAELAHEFAPSSTSAPSGGFEAAKSAAAAAAAASSSTGGAAPAPDAPKLTPAEQAQAAMEADPVGATVATAQMLFTLSVSTIARVQRVELTPVEFQALAMLSPQEVATLRAYAPMAAPYLMRALSAAPVLGALAFAGALVMPMAQRFSELKKIRAARPPKPKTPAKPAPPATPQEKAADSPPGVVRDAVTSSEARTG